MIDNNTYTGTISWFKDKYGFIEWIKDNIKQKDIFLHYSDINMSEFKTCQKGQKVQFKIGTNYYGDLKAIDVIIILS